MGSPEDEDFLSVMVEVLEAGEGRTQRGNPWTTRALRDFRRGDTPPVSAGIQQIAKHSLDDDPTGTRRRWQALSTASLGEHDVAGTYHPERDPEYRKRYAPAALGPELLAKIRRVHHGATVDALPRMPGEEKAVGSALRAKVAGWMASAAGKEWARRRAELLGDPNAPDDIDAAVEEDRV